MKKVSGRLGPALEQAREVSKRHQAIMGMLGSWGLHPGDGLNLLLDISIGIGVMTKDGIPPDAALDSIEKLFAEKVRVAREATKLMQKIEAAGKNPMTMPEEELAGMTVEVMDLREDEDGGDGKHEEIEPQRTVLVGKLVRHKICDCGYGFIKEGIALGTEYRLLSDTIREAEMVCGGCGKKHTISVARVIDKCTDCGGEHAVGLMALNCLDFGEGAS